MSGQLNFWGTPNVTSSPAVDSGLTAPAKPDGPMIAPSGQALVPADLSPRQAKSLGLLTSGTYGLPSSISSSTPSRTMYRSLESRLRARTALLGSTLYKLTWKPRTTPSGRSISALRASVRRSSDKGFFGWRSPTKSDAERGVEFDPKSRDAKAGTGSLNNEAALAGWTAPSSLDWKDTPGMATERPDGRSRIDQLPRQALLTGCAAPRAEDSESAGMRHSRGVADTLTARSMQLAGWPNPIANDSKGSTHCYSQGDHGKIALKLPGTAQIAGPARLTASGELLTGSTAGMTSGGQLNPEHSFWLMAIPKELVFCALRGMQSISKSQRRSSKRISKQPHDRPRAGEHAVRASSSTPPERAGTARATRTDSPRPGSASASAHHSAADCAEADCRPRPRSRPRCRSSRRP